ncbi:hypothetical protein C8R43DRAFT_1121577 [Mycena crocata]|nr:hypothetical protein C8R43DRAFT_1121577 [Mycena crocata]
MLWIPTERKTRRGTVFSPFAAQILPLQSHSFDFGSVLAEAISSEPCDQDEDDHHQDDELDELDEPKIDASPPPVPHVDAPLMPPNPLEGIDEEYPPTDALNDLDDIDDVHPRPPTPPAPPAKRRRTALDDMREGKKPLTGSHRRRKAKATQKVQQQGQPASASTILGVVQPAQPLDAALDAQTLPAARGAYAGKVGETWGSKKRRGLDEFIGMGFTLVRWNGYDARPLVDAQGRIFAVLAGQPRDPQYAAAVARAYDKITEEGSGEYFPYDERRHRRGLFAVVNVGLSYGKGQIVPCWLATHAHTAMIDRLIADEDIKRMATFASAAFCLWAPRLYEYYREHKAALHKRMPHLGYIFGCSVFFAAGPFDPTKGGHLVLWDLKLVIEFPPGALILLPSATINHSNVPVQEGDKRVSFTQFTAGGLFRYVDNGFRTEAALASESPKEYAKVLAQKETRWDMGLGLLSTMDELLSNLPP